MCVQLSRWGFGLATGSCGASQPDSESLPYSACPCVIVGGGQPARRGCDRESSAGSADIRRTVKTRDQVVSDDLLAQRVSLLGGGGHGGPTARDKTSRPQVATQSGGASAAERALEPRGGFGADPGVGPGGVR